MQACAAACGRQSGAVLVEFTQVKQEAAGFRRWFEDKGMDLIVWHGADAQPTGFQICYVHGQEERALTWHPPGGFSHARVDAGDTRPDKNLAPVLVPGGEVPWTVLREEFGRRARGLEPALRDWIERKLEGKE